MSDLSLLTTTIVCQRCINNNHGLFRREACGNWGAFAGAVSGYSAAYYAAQAGAVPEREPAGSCYVKEAPDRWLSRGLEALGLIQGATVEIELDELGRPVEAGAFFTIFDQ